MKSITALFAFLLLTGFSWPQANEISLPSAGREDAKIYLPSQFSPDKKWPIVLLLHGYVGSSFLIDTYFGLSERVTSRGFILIVPNGRSDSQQRQFWNASPACCDFDHTGSDDIGYLTSILKIVAEKYSGDKKSISVVGHSNGGFMAYKLACAKNSLIHSVVSFAGEIDSTAVCQPGHPISVLQIQAVDDDTIHYKGDLVGYPTLKAYPGAEASVQKWVKLDGCEPTPLALAPLSLTLSEPGPDTDVFAHLRCADGSQVQLWRIKPYDSAFHFPHTPLLRGTFSDLILDFALGAHSSDSKLE